MIDTVLTWILKSCSNAVCSRLSLVGVLLLSGWAVAHSADGRVDTAKAEGEAKNLQTVLANAKEDREALKIAIEKLRLEMKENNADSKKQLEKLEALLLRLLARS